MNDYDIVIIDDNSKLFVTDNDNKMIMIIK